MFHNFEWGVLTMLTFPRWKSWTVVMAIVAGILLALPSLLPAGASSRLPAFLQSTHVNLGLDLAGGSHLLLEAKPGDVAKLRLEAMEELIRREYQRAETRIEIRDVSTANGQLSFVVTDPAQVGRAVQIARTNNEPVGVAGQHEFDIRTAERGRVIIRPTQAGVADALSRAMDTAREVIYNRVDPDGTREVTVVRQGRDRILVQVPGVDDPESLKALLGQTAKLEFKLVDLGASAEKLASGRAPGSEILPYPEAGQGGIAVQRRALITGDQISDARQEFDPETGQAVVTIQFNSEGARRFARITKENVNRPFAIILDNVVLSAPNIAQPILGGSAKISGNFDTKSANELAVQLRSGRLPVDLQVVEERSVGPDLGKESIEKAVVAGLIGTALILAFMFLVYGRFGVYANVALILNVFLIIGMMAVFNATLTLPGIAGFVLTIGAAVDANVIINERILEEHRRGRTPLQAIQLGYKEAQSAIFDANITNVIAGALLFYFGTGPVRGFAVVMIIGIITSVFTAVTVTRLIVSRSLRKKGTAELGMRRRLKLVPDSTNIGFLKWRKPSMFLSALLIVASFGMLATKGLNFGVDFAGGQMIRATFEQPVSLDELRGRVRALGLGEPSIQQFGSAQEVAIRLPLPSGGEEGANAAATNVRQALAESFPGSRIDAVETVSGKVSSELVRTGALSLLLAMIAVSIYIWLRFEWQFGAASLFSLFHDLMLTLGFLSLTQVEFDLNVVAALLTLIGYSLNDNIVIFDRIRENLRRYRKMILAPLIDLSINETLSRTASTNVSMLLALGTLLAIGPDTIYNFTLTLLISVLVGTYSTTFVASPWLIWLGVTSKSFIPAESRGEDVYRSPRASVRPM